MDKKSLILSLVLFCFTGSVWAEENIMPPPGFVIQSKEDSTNTFEDGTGTIDTAKVTSISPKNSVPKIEADAYSDVTPKPDSSATYGKEYGAVKDVEKNPWVEATVNLTGSGYVFRDDGSNQTRIRNSTTLEAKIKPSKGARCDPQNTGSFTAVQERNQTVTAYRKDIENYSSSTQYFKASQGQTTEAENVNAHGRYAREMGLEAISTDDSPRGQTSGGIFFNYREKGDFQGDSDHSSGFEGSVEARSGKAWENGRAVRNYEVKESFTFKKD